MALKMQHYSDTFIQKLGILYSTTQLQYIHTQVAHLAKGAAFKMSKELSFYNITFIEASTYITTTTQESILDIPSLPIFSSPAVPKFLSSTWHPLDQSESSVGVEPTRYYYLYILNSLYWNVLLICLPHQRQWADYPTWILILIQGFIQIVNFKQ